MTAFEQVAQLKQRAIELLLSERQQIDSELNQLGYGQEKAATKRRGRPPNPKVETMQQIEPPSQSDTIRSTSL
jgi:hypothetical protein